LETIAEAGGICISRTAYDQIEDKLPLGYEYIGEQTAKNLRKPIRAYKVNIWPETHTSKVLKSGMAKAGHRVQQFSSQFKRQDPQTKKHKKILKSKQRFMFHLKGYLGIIGFLFIINILTGHDHIWFHWPALGWGLFLYLHWLKASYTGR
jgi:adenylate cyclase